MQSGVTRVTFGTKLIGKNLVIRDQVFLIALKCWESAGMLSTHKCTYRKQAHLLYESPQR